MEERLCLTCKSDISSRRKDAKYCSGECRSTSWRVENPESARNWYKVPENKETADARARAYQRSHIEEYSERGRAWRKENRERYLALKRVNEHKRRSHYSAGAVTADEWLKLLEKYEHRCLKCGGKEDLTMDHVIPLSKGGSHTIDNIQPLCRPCNTSKGNRSSADYRRK